MPEMKSLKIEIDRGACIGDGACVAEAPETFFMGDDSIACVQDKVGDEFEAIMGPRNVPGRLHQTCRRPVQKAALPGRGVVALARPSNRRRRDGATRHPTVCRRHVTAIHRVLLSMIR